MTSRRLVVIVAAAAVALIAGSVTSFALWSSRQAPKASLRHAATASPTASASADLGNLFGVVPTNSPSPSPSASPTASETATSPPVVTAVTLPLPTSSTPGLLQARIGTDADGRALLVTTEMMPGGAMQTMTTTWTWDGSRWKALRSDPPIDGGSNLVYDPSLKKVVELAGGITGSPYSMWGWDVATWMRDMTGWANFYPETIPAGGLYPALVTLDPTSHQLVAVMSEMTTTSTWTFEGRTWTKAATATNPPARRLQAMAYDPATSTTVLYGGDLVMGGSSPLDDTWTWDGTGWTQQHPATTPGGCSGAQLAYDATTRQMVLFCVREQPYRSRNFSVSTWSWTGTTWTQLHPNTMPPAAFTPSMTYDTVHGELVLFLGPVSGSTSQTWTYANGQWKRAA